MRDMKNLFNGKKLLIIGGAFHHVKVVEKAKHYGIETHVVDYLPREQAPAKLLADYSYEIDIFDTDAIVKMCQEKKIDGVLASNLDICQNPYQQVCERLNLPCYGTRDQYEIFTDKTRFQNVCTEYGIHTIPRYTEEGAFALEEGAYPLMVKPAESSSSKGQTICYSVEELTDAIRIAKERSLNGRAVIERYMAGCPDMAVCGYVHNHSFHVVRVGDRYLGTDGMERSEVFGVHPSRYTDLYFDTMHEKVEAMLNGLGINDCPVFLQGIVDGGQIRFYDPGLRFSGCEYEKAFERIYGLNLVEFGIHIALGVSIPAELVSFEIREKKQSQYAALLYIPIRAGVIGSVRGLEAIRNHPDVVAVQTQYKVGDEVVNTYTAKQRFCEIDFVAGNLQELRKDILWIYETLLVVDNHGNNMIFSGFDVSKLCVYGGEV